MTCSCFHHRALSWNVPPLSTISAGFPVWFLHGRADCVAMPKFAEKLARKLGAPCLIFSGGHLVFSAATCILDVQIEEE
eukprot:scaffold223098_cov20-Tisochrysis_lutea.AAC.2